MVITPQIILQVSDIVDEFILNHQKRIESPKEFRNNQIDESLMLNIINSDQFIDDPEKIAVPQLYLSKSISQKVRGLAMEIQQKDNINCYASELINPLMGFFCKLINELILSDIIIDDLIKEKLPLFLISIRKKLLKKRTFGFPYHMMGLNQDINLTDSISIELSQDDDLDERDKESYLYDRHFLHNAFMKVILNEKISPELGFERAKKVSIFIANFINFYSHLIYHDYSTHSPCLSSSAKIKNYYEFHVDYNHRNERNKSHTRRFPYNKPQSERFWNFFIELWNDESYKNDKDFICGVMSISTVHNNKRRVFDCISNAINWYSDAFVEDNSESRIVKCVTALESLVNYAEDIESSDSEGNCDKIYKNDNDGVTRRFRIRIGKLYHENDRTKIENQAKEIYSARSDIVHGSGLKEPLSFCPIKFCRKTIHNALVHFYRYGLERVDYKQNLPIYISKIK